MVSVILLYVSVLVTIIVGIRFIFHTKYIVPIAFLVLLIFNINFKLSITIGPVSQGRVSYASVFSLHS